MFFFCFFRGLGIWGDSRKSSEICFVLGFFDLLLFFFLMVFSTLNEYCYLKEHHSSLKRKLLEEGLSFLKKHSFKKNISSEK